MIHPSPKFSIFDIHLILEPIVSSLSAKDIDHCRLVSRDWYAIFTPFRRLSATQWMSPLTIVEQERLLLQGPYIRTATIPMNDPSFDKLIYDPKSQFCSNLSDLTCLGRDTYPNQIDKTFYRDRDGRNPHLYSPEMKPGVIRSFKYNLPNKVQRLLETSRRLQSLRIQYEYIGVQGLPDERHRGEPFQSHEQFSVGMVRALSEHKTLTSVILDCPGSIDWHGIQAILHSLPDTIEIFEVFAGCGTVIQSPLSTNSRGCGNIEDDAIITAQVTERKEPYRRLRRFLWDADLTHKMTGGLIAFLRLCPNLQGLEGSIYGHDSLLVDTLLEHCPRMNHLELTSWSAEEQLRLARGYAFQKLRVHNSILFGQLIEIEAGHSTGINNMTPPSPLRDSSVPKLTPCLALSRDTLQVLELTGSYCTPYHDLDTILFQFPNLRELDMTWFDFDKIPSTSSRQEWAQAHEDTIPFTIANKSLRKLTLHVCSRDQDYYNHYDDESSPGTSATGPNPLVPSSSNSNSSVSSVSMAPKIARLHSRLNEFQSLQELQVLWSLTIRTQGEISQIHYCYNCRHYCSRLDVRGPLQEALLSEYGLDQGALESLNLYWTKSPQCQPHPPHRLERLWLSLRIPEEWNPPIGVTKVGILAVKLRR
ncbi:hypothetical protein BGZ83_004074 [Gryganskiella cystojenkinii]|nr:hypothetical protein BGZ83_004074 [Gryganskiella cystojenkinii]